jgi:hypothetical protein
MRQLSGLDVWLSEFRSTDPLVEHHSRESFMRATGVARAPGVGQTPPVPELTEDGERQMRAAMRKAYAAPGRRQLLDAANSDDEGELRCAVTADRERNLVVLNFGTPVAWLSASPDQIRQIALQLLRSASQLDGKTLEVRTS